MLPGLESTVSDCRNMPKYLRQKIISLGQLAYRHFVTFYISALEILLLTYLYLQTSTLTSVLLFVRVPGGIMAYCSLSNSQYASP